MQRLTHASILEWCLRFYRASFLVGCHVVVKDGGEGLTNRKRECLKNNRQVLAILYDNIISVVQKEGDTKEVYRSIFRILLFDLPALGADAWTSPNEKTLQDILIKTANSYSVEDVVSSFRELDPFVNKTLAFCRKVYLEGYKGRLGQCKVDPWVRQKKVVLSNHKTRTHLRGLVDQLMNRDFGAYDEIFSILTEGMSCSLSDEFMVKTFEEVFPDVPQQDMDVLTDSPYGTSYDQFLQSVGGIGHKLWIE